MSTMQACESCHRMKVRCDRGRDGSTCTRCRKGKRRCTMSDKASRRLKGRGNRGIILQESPSSSTEKSKALQSTSSPAILPVYSARPVPGTVEAGQCHFGPCSLSEAEFTALLESFHSTAAISLPIFDLDRSRASASHEKLLGWTMCYVSARITIPWLAQELESTIMIEVSQRLLQPPKFLQHGLVTVKVLLLLAMWPPSHANLMQDPAWLYLGYAVSFATLLGLHRPFAAEQFLAYPKLDRDEQLASQITWLGCYFVSIVVANAKGLCPLIQDDSIIRQVCGQKTAPADIGENLHCLVQLAKAIEYQLVLDEVSSKTRLMTRLCSQSNTFWPCAKTDLTPWQKSLAIYVRLRVHTLLFKHDGDMDQAEQADIAASGLIMCFDLLDIIAEMQVQPYFATLPVSNTILLWIFHAVLLICGIRNSSLNACVEAKAAERAFLNAKRTCLALVNDFDTKPSKISAMLESFGAHNHIMYESLSRNLQDYCRDQVHIFHGLTNAYIKIYRGWLLTSQSAVLDLPDEVTDWDELLSYFTVD